MVVIIRTTAGFAISTARTTGSATLPPGMPSAYVVFAPATAPRIAMRHAIPTSISVRGNVSNQYHRLAEICIDVFFCIVSVLPLVLESESLQQHYTSYRHKMSTYRVNNSCRSYHLLTSYDSPIGSCSITSEYHSI